MTVHFFIFLVGRPVPLPLSELMTQTQASKTWHCLGEQKNCSSLVTCKGPFAKPYPCLSRARPMGARLLGEANDSHFSFISFRRCCSGSAQPSGACTFFAIGPFRWLENASTKGSIWKILIENIWDVTSQERLLLFCGC